MPRSYTSDDGQTILKVSESTVLATARLRHGWQARWYIDGTTGEPAAPWFLQHGRRDDHPPAGIEQAGRPDRHRAAVDRLLRQARRDWDGLPVRQTKRRQGPGRHRLHDEIVRMYEQGMNPTQIGTMLDVPTETARSVLRRAKVTSHRKRRQESAGTQANTGARR